MTEHRRRYEARMEHVARADAAYDHSDLGARGIVAFLIGLAIVVLFIHIVIFGFIKTYAYFEPQGIARNRAVTAPPVNANADPLAKFPTPRLQSDELTDMDKLRAQEEKQLNTSGWVDEKEGVAHIPVNRAMDVVAQHGLPVRPQQPQGQEAKFGSGDNSVAGAGGGTLPRGNK
jgi:hypothetical protein